MGKTKQKQDRSHYLFSNQELANLIGPLVIEQLLAVFVGMADSIMVANVGEAAVSGVSLVDNIMIPIINIFAALATVEQLLPDSILAGKMKNQHVKRLHSWYGL